MTLEEMRAAEVNAIAERAAKARESKFWRQAFLAMLNDANVAAATLAADAAVIQAKERGHL